MQLDGLLFYHKKTHYTFGPSPLVVWLKAYMLPEILGISVPAELLALAPSTYRGFNDHAEAVRQRKHNMEWQAGDGKSKPSGLDQCEGDSSQTGNEMKSLADCNVAHETHNTNSEPVSDD